jgi:proline iminopeptidase
MRKQEMDWFFGGCRVLVPQAWSNLLSGLHPSERDNPCEAYYARLTHADTQVQIEAAKRWGAFEHSLALGRSDKLQARNIS